MRRLHVEYSPEKDASLEETRTSRTLTSTPEPMHLNFSWSSTGRREIARLYLTAEDPEFDPVTIQHWKDEGFEVTYLPYNGDARSFKQQLHGIGDTLDLGDRWVLVGTTPFWVGH
jgi:hypothetical protein